MLCFPRRAAVPDQGTATAQRLGLQDVQHGLALAPCNTVSRSGQGVV